MILIIVILRGNSLALSHWIPSRRIVSSKYPGDSVVDSVFHISKIDKIWIWLKVAYLFVVDTSLLGRWTLLVKKGPGRILENKGMRAV